MTSLTTLIASEESLLQEAALALPHSFDKCTYSLGPLRQAVHLCLTCAIPRGLCAACSVACHGDHEQIELFPKRNFVCDCPTHVGGMNCTLHSGPMPVNSSNRYGQNFEAKFCRCGRSYDAKHERETMIQCLTCEDWFHESCLHLRTRPSERPLSPHPPTATVENGADADSTASNDLPPPLLPSSAYETLICGACVLSNDTLRRWAGTNGIMMVIKRGGTEEAPEVEDGGIDPRWKILDGNEDDSPVELDVTSEGQERKRSLEKDESDEDRDRLVKRLRTDDGSTITVYEPGASQAPDPASLCLAPLPNPSAQRVLDRTAAIKTPTEADTKPDDIIGSADIFLTEGWRDRWCRCSKCLSSFEAHPYLLKEEETYEPPEDPDSGMSFEELGMRALQNVPRDRAIDGIRAYNAMRDELMTYLRPFAREGRIVAEQDVREFFESRSQQREDSDTTT